MLVQNISPSTNFKVKLKFFFISGVLDKGHFDIKIKKIVGIFCYYIHFFKKIKPKTLSIIFNF